MKIKIFLILIFILLVSSVNSLAMHNNHHTLDSEETISNHTEKGKIFFENKNARIDFIKEIEFSYTQHELQHAMIFRKNSVEINSKDYPDLNKPATITFKNVDLKRPYVFRNGVMRRDIPIFCMGNTCKVFVTSFSEWTLQENNWNGTFNGTTIQQTNLTIDGDSVQIFDFSKNSTEDLSIYNNYADNSGARWLATGEFEFLFSEKNNMTVPSHDKIEFTDENWSIGVMYKTYNKLGTHQIILSKGSPSAFTPWSFWINTGGVLYIPIGKSGCGSWHITTQLTAGILSDNEYHQVWVTKNGSRMELFVDGTFKDSANLVNNEICNLNRNLGIGSATTSLGNIQHFNGTVKYVQILPRIVDGNEILSINNSYVNNIYKKEGGNYSSVIHNATDFFPVIESNVWNNVSVGGTFYNTDDVSLGARAGDCDTFQTLNYTFYNRSGNNFIFDQPTQGGKCLQLKFMFNTTNGSLSSNLINYTVYSDTLLSLSNQCDRIVKTSAECNLYSKNTACGTFKIYNKTTQVNSGVLTGVNTDLKFMQFNESVKGDYTIYFCDGTTKEITVGDEEMAGSGGIAIALFILAINFGLFALPFLKNGQLVKNQFANIVLKRSVWAIAIQLMMLNSSIMATVAVDAGLNITQEMLRYVWFFGVAGWLAFLFLIISTLFEIIKMYKVKKLRGIEQLEDNEFNL